MSHLLNLSEATSIAMHAMVYLAANEDTPCSTSKVGSSLQLSEAHLAKVFQRLGKVGLVRSIRGPGGGFMLARERSGITLLEVYEAIEGPFLPADCLMDKSVCKGSHCILGGLLQLLNKEMEAHLSNTKISDLTGVYKTLRRERRATASDARQQRGGE